MSSERIMNLLVTIPAESRRMNVGKDVIRILGSPAYICILQRKDRQSIAITPCAAEHPMSFKVPDRLLTDGQCRMRINGVQFVQALLEANGLAAGKDYQLREGMKLRKTQLSYRLKKMNGNVRKDGKIWNTGVALLKYFAGLNSNQNGQYGQIYAEKFTSACLICKVFYGKMKA